MLGCLKTLREQLMAEEFSGQTPIRWQHRLTNEGAGSRKSITWTSPKEQVFEMPTGGSAIMRQQKTSWNWPKEYCIALGGQQLRTKFRITDYKIYRVYPNGKSNTCIRLMASSQRKLTQAVRN